MIKDRLKLLREVMAQKGYDFVFIPSNDPHFSEYTPLHWKCREFISGFNGSAGKVLVSMTEALLWTDSRYFLQAEEQLKDTSFKLMKEGIEGFDTFEEYISEFKGKTLALNTNLISINNYDNLSNNCEGINLCNCDDIFEELWKDRPALGSDEIIVLKPEISGATTLSKIEKTRKKLNLGENEAYIISPLDQSAWLLNIRGTDIEFNPLNVCYTVIESEQTLLFIKKEKVNQQVASEFEKSNIFIHDYSEFDDYLHSLNNKTIILNTNSTSYKTYDTLSKSGCTIKAESDNNGVINTLKSVKNEVEIAGFRKAMTEDGIALVKFYMWLEQELSLDENTVTEYELGQKLAEFRALSPLYFSESFAPIVGYGKNGAIVHYSADKDTASIVKADNFLLIDSGAQYYCGTTDITRTVHLGMPTSEQKKDFTLVLQGHINLASAVFPKNTRGAQLDFLARAPLCAHSMNYLHGTGHGIGHFLNVHEGVQSIRMNENPVILECGMITSNEPGLYKTGEYGIRCENLILCAEHSKSEFGTFNHFETLTLFPFDTKSIEISMLTSDQKLWLNSFHTKVYETLSPCLNETQQLWLKAKTAHI